MTERTADLLIAGLVTLFGGAFVVLPFAATAFPGATARGVDVGRVAYAIVAALLLTGAAPRVVRGLTEQDKEV